MSRQINDSNWLPSCHGGVRACAREATESPLPQARSVSIQARYGN
jgi:hypothetical protein